MWAIRAKRPGGFRRDGVSFSGREWTLLEHATREQLAEPWLEAVRVDGPDDPKLAEMALVEAGIAPSGKPGDTAEENALIEQLQAENAEMRVDNAYLRAQVVSLQEARAELQARLNALESEPTADTSEAAAGESAQQEL